MAVNYLDYVKQVKSPFEAAVTGYQISQTQQLEEAKRQQLQQEKQNAIEMQKELAELTADPSKINPKSINALMLKYPSMAESLKIPAERIDEQTRQNRIQQAQTTANYLRVGQPDKAIELLKSYKTGAENAGDVDTANSFDALITTIEESPEAGLLGLGAFQAANMKGEDFAASWEKIQSTQEKIKLEPTVLKQKLQDLEIGEANINKLIIDAKEGEARIKKTNADAANVAADTAIKKAQLGKERVVELTKDGEKLVNESVEKSVNSKSLAFQYRALADGLNENLTSGLVGKAEEKIKSVWGSTDQVSRLRQEYQRLKNTQVLNSLPPGVASDKDIELATAAFPEATDNPETIALFLHGMSRLQEWDAAMNEFKATWVNNNGNLGNLSKDMVIDGETYPAGTKFTEALNRKIANVSPVISMDVTPENKKKKAGAIEKGGQTDVRSEADKILGL